MAYISIDDLRDEGFPSCDFPDRRANKAIKQAQAFIERITGQWFEPRELTLTLDGWANFEHVMDVPIISVFELRFRNNDGTAPHIVDPAEYAVYNRHLSQGLLNPDDRQNPLLAFKRFGDDSIHRHDVTRVSRAFPEFSRFFERNKQNVQVQGVFGFTDPDFTAGRTVASDGGDSITAPNTIVMTNGAFTSRDIGTTPAIAGSAANDGTVTVRRIINATTIEVAETLVTEGSGFTLVLPTFPQGGVTPEEIKRATLLLAAKRLGKIAFEDPVEDAISGGRVRRMKVRDQEIQFSADTRVANGEAIWSGDPEIDTILASYMRPPRIGAA
jgi:hypothetical protein